MTAIAAAWDDEDRVWMAADSRCSGHMRPAQKMWRWGRLTLALAGEAAIGHWLIRQHAGSDPGEDVEGALWGLLDSIREHAASRGLTLDGNQGQRFVGCTIIASDGARIWLVQDGWSVEEVRRSSRVVGAGDRTAVEAAYIASQAAGIRDTEQALGLALDAVCRV